MYKPVDATPKFPVIEHSILEYWKTHKIFEKSIDIRPESRTWTFLDGPPFVTGMPHYGSLLSSLPKDLYGRYWTMKGYRVRRVWGWDGHGLPIENKVENELHIKRKRDIEETVGVKVFIEKCKEYVDQISAEWEWYVDHIGRWVDFKNAYRTWDRDYMESVMWVFKQMYEKGYVYKGLRVSLYCPHCATPVSNFEVAMDADNYKDVTESATTYKYEVVGGENTYFLAWSTTPWNKIVTPALAVNPSLAYVKVKQGDSYYILGRETVKMLTDEPYTVVEEFKGSTLVGMKFIPHYDFYEIEPGKKAFEIVGGDFVTEDEGTGIVTLAVYGEEDLAVMKAQNIQMVFHVDEEGMIREHVPHFGGMYYLKANKAVNEDLTRRGLVYRDDAYTHSVAHCWRCATRLFYNPLTAWYVSVKDLKPRMKNTNEKVNWYPHHFKHGRFEKSMDSAPDWNISRNRYWGSPVPVWECECGQMYVPGSIAELESRAGRSITDLHKPEIDEVMVECAACHSVMRRTPEVLDSWIEAGSASFAERHFPFDRFSADQISSMSLDDPAMTEALSSFFPPDYIAEYTGQIRAWFYVLHVIAAALYDSPAFKNVSVTGVIMGTDGRKMSKNFKNYPDPKEMLEKYGGDALRLYLLGSPVMRGEDILISEQQYRNQVRGLILVLWNVYKFYVTYANLNSYTPHPVTTPTHVLDRWILSKLNRLVRDVTTNLDAYDSVGAIDLINSFVNEVSTWYLRRSRDRMSAQYDDDADRESCFDTMNHVLITITQLLAPIAPFVSEEIYRALTGHESVHLTDWPQPAGTHIDDELEAQMIEARHIVELGHSIRREAGIGIKQPLQSMYHHEPTTEVTDVAILQIVLDELNIKDIIKSSQKDTFVMRDGVISREDANRYVVALDTNISEELRAEGEARVIVRKIQEERKRLGKHQDEYVRVTMPVWPAAHAEDIKKKAMISELVTGDEFKVE